MRLAIIITAAAGALIAGPTVADADPPPGWGPGPGAFESDLGYVNWVHHGWYQGARGNWHTGELTMEESDDGLTGELVDWWCPGGVEPPTRVIDSAGTTCKIKRSQWIDYHLRTDVSDFDQARNRLTVHGDYPVVDDLGNEIDTVRIDLAIQGRGEPDVTSDESGPVLDYSEYFQNTHASGRVDGRRVSGPRTTQTDEGLIGFFLDGWVRTP